MSDNIPPFHLGADNVIRTHLTGFGLLTNPRLNKGTAFTEEERDAFALHGLLPPHIGTLEDQRERRKIALHNRDTSFGKYRLMRDLQDNDETLFYSFIAHNVEELLPIVYTPAVGEGCQRFSEIWRKPRGLFLSYPNKDRIEKILSHPRYDNIRCIVVSDGERILGLGDQGAGGMGIPIGKMALYTALGGIPPEHCLPILLDVGTDNESLLNDPIYIGWRHNRIRGQEYDDFVEAFVSAVERRWPHILLQWEDFAGVNAARLLERYRDRLCTFNDDIQGTAAVTTATLLAAVHATGSAAARADDCDVRLRIGWHRHYRIADFCNERRRPERSRGSQAHLRIQSLRACLSKAAEGFVRSRRTWCASVKTLPDGSSQVAEDISLLDVVRNAKVTVLAGVSAQAGAFTEEIVREMARHIERPVIFPLSNPTSKSEALPADLLRWTDGRALVGSGSPFPPVEVNGKMVRISQINNSYIFPGLALGILVSRARRVTDNMIMAAARTLASLSPARNDKNEALLPPISDSRKVGLIVGEAVAHQAVADGVADAATSESMKERIDAYVWEPVYLPYERVDIPR